MHAPGYGECAFRLQNHPPLDPRGKSAREKRTLFFVHFCAQKCIREANLSARSAEDIPHSLVVKPGFLVVFALKFTNIELVYAERKLLQVSLVFWWFLLKNSSSKSGFLVVFLHDAWGRFF